ncbi:MAG: metallophosphoesterase [Campylobacterota bacterium]|nr:metallophosphoesterase [Campylobacterota bacterium]
MITIKENSIFIADSHYNNEREILFTMLSKIQNKEIETSQIFLMGDMFDFLSEEIEYFKTINHKVISLINRLSVDKEIIYLEGNHDFNLSNIFPNLEIITRENQPLNIVQDSKNISISHGDIFTPIGYEIYTKIIRNHYVMKFLNLIDFNNWLSKKIEQDLKKKNICHKQKDFDNFIAKRVDNYNTDLVIEGHFHQGYIDEKYINLPSLCCDKRYMVYLNGKFEFNSL